MQCRFSLYEQQLKLRVRQDDVALQAHQEVLQVHQNHQVVIHVPTQHHQNQHQHQQVVIHVPTQHHQNQHQHQQVVIHVPTQHPQHQPHQVAHIVNPMEEPLLHHQVNRSSVLLKQQVHQIQNTHRLQNKPLPIQPSSTIEQ